MYPIVRDVGNKKKFDEFWRNDENIFRFIELVHGSSITKQDLIEKLKFLFNLRNSTSTRMSDLIKELGMLCCVKDY